MIGAGPAGLTASWHLARLGKDVVVLEQDAVHVGGLACTMEHAGHRFDVGPHRFYTKSDGVKAMWRAMLPDQFVEVSRLTRIWYEGKFYPYPLALGATLRQFGIVRSLRALFSCLAARVAPRGPEASFEDWTINRFGVVLYRAFFKTYTEKVWGTPCAQIHKDWAAQRIRGLSLLELVKNALPFSRKAPVKSLIERFDYPRRGAGQLWEAAKDEIERRGGRVLLDARVVRVERERGAIRAVITSNGTRHEGTHFHVTMTLKEFVAALDPPAPPEIRAAADGLRHRDFITVAVIVPRKGLFPDQWIYVHDPSVRVARITNPANWSEEMSPRDTTALGLEYFCDRGDDLWSMDDSALVALAARELKTIGLVKDDLPRDGSVHRFVDAYPIYDDGYRERRETLKAWIAGNLSNAYPAGRKGLHNYNSQDHAMMTATYGVRNATEEARLDPWSINTEDEYAEEGAGKREIEERLVPRKIGELDA